MNIKNRLLLYCLAACFSTTAQTDTSLFERMQAIENGGTIFYNVDGIEITSQKIDGEFSKKTIAKKFRKYTIRENDLTTADSTLALPNFYVLKTKEDPKGYITNTSYYFLEARDKKIVAITFAAINKIDKMFERQFVQLIRDDAVPKNIFTPLKIDSVNFAGRKFRLGPACQWMSVNNIQCSGYGQMNWSVHKTLDDAKQAIDGQFHVTLKQSHGKVISDSTVNIVFEGTETTARKIIYDLKGVTSFLAGMSGGKTLTIYYVYSPVRNHFVSCVMSFWNNDQINASGLAPLLENVMQRK